MRVLIAAPRKSGSAHLRCLLASAYGLEITAARTSPVETDPEAIDAWLAGLPEGSVTGAGYRHNAELSRSATRHGVSFVAILRHPLDLFLSNYDVAQQRAARKKNTPEDVDFWNQFAGRSLEDPEMIAYARGDFASEIDWLLSWQLSGTPTIRFEALSEEPGAVLTSLAPILGDLSAESVSKALQQCPSESLILSSPNRGRRMGELPPGSWQERLPAAIIDAVHQRYAEEIEQLGYANQ